jgi:ankyrin repeat protein
MFAVERNYALVVDTLLSQGADPNMRDKEGRNALYYIPASDYTFVATHLQRFHATLDVKDNQGDTPLAYLRKNGEEEVAKFLETNPR